MNEQDQHQALFAAYRACVAKGGTMPPEEISEQLRQAVRPLLEEARNEEREGIACYVESQGFHRLADEVFAGMTRPVDEARRNTAIDAGRENRAGREAA